MKSLLLLIRYFFPMRLLAILVAGLAINCSAMDRFEALAEIESGSNDYAVGAAGERGRYQMLEATWREYTPKNCWPNFQWMTNKPFAICAAQGVMNVRTMKFIKLRGRQPTNVEFYLLWHREAVALGGRKPTNRESECASRFENLCQTKN